MSSGLLLKDLYMETSVLVIEVLNESSPDDPLFDWDLDVDK